MTDVTNGTDLSDLQWHRISHGRLLLTSIRKCMTGLSAKIDTRKAPQERRSFFYVIGFVASV